MDSRNAAPLPAEDDEIPLDPSSEESDSSSDVSMADSDDSDESERNLLISTGNEHIPVRSSLSTPAAAFVSASQQSQGSSKKRKSVEGADSTSHTILSTKKVKLGDSCNQQPSTTPSPSDKSLLPAEIWQCIFAFTPPRTLGNLLRVNKLFNVYLDPSSRYQCNPPPSPSQTSAPLLKSDAIWQISRRRFWQRMPAPLQHKTELEMWRLACGKTCQFCGRTDSASPKPSGDEHRRIQSVWAFALRSCGPCLVENTIKEFDLLLSSSIPSLLMPALPFVLITNDMRTISADALRKGLVQSDLQVTKVYLLGHVENLKQEFLSVKSMGGATAEEWLKGLETRGKELLNDSMRWEKWASTGGVAQMQSLDIVPSVTTANGKGLCSANICSATPGSQLSPSNVTGQHTPSSHQSTPIRAISQPTHTPVIQIQNDSAAHIPSVPHGIHSNAPRTRTREEAVELKATRRAEIERRAMELDPPLTANVLAHIPSFQAAIQIISPLDDNAWKLLKPRLLAQRVDAEQREKHEKEASIQSHKASEQPEERHLAGENNIATKQLIDKTWDEVQTPLRARISAYADEIIRDSWDDGQKVDSENSPQFAAEVLIHVRGRFYAEINKESAAARAAGREIVEDLPEGPYTKKLTLENMKWLFDVKIKPHTESYRKDLFYCNGCEVNLKAFGFEGVIQHYAAKHTNALSLGSVVVHWRAEWPETPPFKPDPHVIKAVHPPTGSSYGALPSQNNIAPHYLGASTYSSVPNPGSFQPPSYGTAPPGYGHPAYGPTLQQSNLYEPRTFYAPGQHEYNSSYPHPPTYNPHDSIYRGSQPPFPSATPSGLPTYPPGDPYYSHNYNATQSNSQMSFHNAYSNSPAGKYHAQLEYLARSSRELWISMAAFKELPGDIRVCVVIYHLVQRFRSTFSETPSLAMFNDGLSNNKEMRPVRNVNGLICKACHLGLGDGVSIGQDRRTFSLPQLVSHFQQRHADQPQAGSVPLDWTVHMVYTPDLSALSNIGSSANIDNQKLSLVFEAFPPAQYSNGHPQGVPSAGPQASQFISQYDPSSLRSVAWNDPATPTIQDTTYATISDQRINIDQLTPIGTPPLGPYRKSQQGDPGRASSETWQGSNGPRPKRQKGTFTKDHRTTSGQGFRNRKSGAVPASIRGKSQGPNEEDLITEEERRQEEEIRAMWAADRKEAARLASGNQHPIEPDEPDGLATTLGAERQRNLYNQVAPTVRPPTYQARIQDYRRPMAVQEREEDDLMAGLETQLDQQQVSAEQFGYGPRHGGNFNHGREPYGRYVDPGQGRHMYPDQGHSYDRDRPASPVYVRHQSRPHSGQYYEDSPSANLVDLTRGVTRTVAVPDDLLYNRPSGQDYPHTYTDDPRARQSVPKYAEAYELVRARDSQGEYFIRRPVRLERDSTYISSQDERGSYGEAAPQYRAYENEYVSNRLEYESTSRTDAPLRQPYEGDARRGSIAKRPYELLSRDDDPAGYEDYDPRFPAAPPSSNIARQVRYQ